MEKGTIDRLQLLISFGTHEILITLDYYYKYEFENFIIDLTSQFNNPNEKFWVIGDHIINFNNIHFIKQMNGFAK